MKLHTLWFAFARNYRKFIPMKIKELKFIFYPSAGGGLFREEGERLPDQTRDFV